MRYGYGRIATFLLATMALVAAGCGGGSDSGTQPTPQPTPTPGPTTILTGTFVGLDADFFRTFDFASPASGTVTATAAWTFATNDLDIFVVSGNTCSTFNAAGVPSGPGCTILCSDVRLTGSTATCSLSATAGNARLMIANFGPGGESGTYSVTVR